ncbi:DUF3131 domain-containing protein [Novosphingobium sp. 1949]|uniref:DUF3131 domain-containing protein n=1 Tax=Novosphingobium organovorum TaxID=2930092 RepID=A0ABT0BIZ1_9SPHN|nr:DUF3131 domain-containing protein [Novosphingobium organovorum]
MRKTQGATGLVNAAEYYPSSTLWDTAGAIGAIVSADQLALTSHEDAQSRLGAILASLRKIPLFRNLCPNKAFNTATLQRTDYSNTPREIGCSALDMGRALVWLRIVRNQTSALAGAVDDLVGYWKIAGMVRGGKLFGTALQKGKVVYLAQEARAKRTGILTARTEHQLAAAPYFVYDTRYAHGNDWATIDARGNPEPQAAAVAMKAAIGLWVLWPRPYTDQLFDAVSGQFDPARGVYEGQLESGGRIEALTANNNGIILEAFAYKVKGALVEIK